MKNKVLIIGHARHGKDSMAEILNKEFGLKFESSSQSAANIFLYDMLKDKYGYKTPEECFEDRVNHRQEWYEAIVEYNKDDRAKLAKGILERSDCYVFCCIKNSTQTFHFFCELFIGTVIVNDYVST